MTRRTWPLSSNGACLSIAPARVTARSKSRPDSARSVAWRSADSTSPSTRCRSTRSHDSNPGDPLTSMPSRKCPSGMFSVMTPAATSRTSTVVSSPGVNETGLPPNVSTSPVPPAQLSQRPSKRPHGIVGLAEQLVDEYLARHRLRRPGQPAQDRPRLVPPQTRDRPAVTLEGRLPDQSDAQHNNIVVSVTPRARGQKRP